MRDTAGCKLLGTGRASWVFDLGDGTVLRRRRNLASSELEAVVMRWAWEHSVPVPKVIDARGPDLIMERVTGPTLLEQLRDNPRIAPQIGETLAALHRSLDRVPPIPELPIRHAESAPGTAGGVLHGDLHPGNVLQSPMGPVLVDWTNAGTGARGADVAESWLILLYADPGIGPTWATTRQQVVESMLAGVDRTAADEHLEAVAVTRLHDPSTSETEKLTIRTLLAERSRP